jgi:Protein kinase domain
VVGLSDFGLASIIAASGEQSVSRDALTPAYAPPESFEEAEPTAAADIYSLAATLYALMAGRPPRFPADSKPGMATIMALHGQPVADIPGVPPSMLTILRQCLEADPARRLPSADALRDHLGGLIGQPARGSGRVAAPPSVLPAADSVSPLQDSGPRSSGGTVSGGSAAYNPGLTASFQGTQAPDGTWGPGSAASDRRPPGSARRSGLGFTAGLHGWRLTALASAVGGGLALLALAAVIVGNHFLSPGGSQSGSGPTGAVGSFGIATTTSNCPAAQIPGAGARCPAAPECWTGIFEAEGVITTSTLPCTGAHTWQTFAIGIMPSSSSSFNVNVVQANPAVRAVCSYAVMLRSRAGQARQIPRSKWMIQVVPPDEAAYDSGIRTYRCLATSGLDGATSPQFGS